MKTKTGTAWLLMNSRRTQNAQCRRGRRLPLCGGKKTWKNDTERVAFLFERYLQLTSLLPAPKAKKAPQRQTRGTMESKV